MSRDHTIYGEILEDLRRAYDARAGARDEVAISAWKAEERARFLAELKQGEKKDLLEIGSGPGRDGKFFQDSGLSVACTDLSPEMVSRCRAKGLNAHVMDFLSLDFPPQSFDAVFALNCLLHVPKASIRDVLRTINALMRPTGLFYMGVYGGEDAEGVLDDDNHEPKRFFTSYTDDQVIQIVSEIFDLVYFRRIELEKPGPVHFQSMMLRARGK